MLAAQSLNFWWSPAQTTTPSHRVRFGFDRSGARTKGSGTPSHRVRFGFDRPLPHHVLCLQTFPLQFGARSQMAAPSPPLLPLLLRFLRMATSPRRQEDGPPSAAH